MSGRRSSSCEGSVSGIRAARLEAGVGGGRRRRERRARQTAGARLGGLAVGFDGAADPAPEVELPAHGGADAVLGAGTAAPRGARGRGATAADGQRVLAV